jgi:hypothetical protein
MFFVFSCSFPTLFRIFGFLLLQKEDVFYQTTVERFD